MTPTPRYTEELSTDGLYHLRYASDPVLCNSLRQVRIETAREVLGWIRDLSSGHEGGDTRGSTPEGEKSESRLWRMTAGKKVTAL